MDGGGPAAGPGRAVRAPAAVAARQAEVRLEAERVGHPAQVAAGAGVGAGVALAHATISSNIPTLLASRSVPLTCVSVSGSVLFRFDILVGFILLII